MKIFRMKVLFWIRKSRINAKGQCVIYCRVTVEGRRAKEFSTGVCVAPEYWSNKKQQIKNNPTKQAILNEIQSRADLLYVDALKNHQYPNPEKIKSKIKHSYQAITILDLCTKFYNQYIDANDCLSTHAKQKTYLNNITKFLVSMRMDKMPCQAFSNSEVELLKMHLMRKKYDALVVNKHLSFIKNTIKLGVKLDYITHFNIVIDNVKMETKLPVFLVEENIIELQKLELNERLEKTRDLFLFQCYTGFAYADLKAFDFDIHISLENGQKWITKAREKTAVKSHLPLLDKALHLLQKHSYKMPVVSNQKYNMALHELEKMLTVQFKLTSHVARKTFGAVMLNAGVSMETVSSMLGHDRLETTQKFYAKVDKRRVLNEIDLIKSAA